jgi:4-hydroxy-tetrahydrodipicolinate reductase
VTRVAIHGASGRLGGLIAQEAAAAMAGTITRAGPVPECQAVIDVTSPEGLSALLPRLSGQALLIGTTGDLPMEALQAYAQTAPVAIVPNFSAGVPLLIELLREAIARMPDDWRVEITEAHHDQKKDAPSGTAKRLARVVEEAGAGNPPMHSIRAGDTIGEHKVWLAGPGERIELTHVATRREVFAIGALRWATWLVEQPPGLYRP